MLSTNLFYTRDKDKNILSLQILFFFSNYIIVVVDIFSNHNQISSNNIFYYSACHYARITNLKRILLEKPITISNGFQQNNLIYLFHPHYKHYVT